MDDDRGGHTDEGDGKGGAADAGELRYRRYLREERAAYAWVMRTHGGMTPQQADAAAADFYVYEPPDDPYRELVFHDEAWHWAMLALKGGQYWRRHPELAHPSAAYDALDGRD